MRSAWVWIGLAVAGCGGSLGVRAASRGDTAAVAAYVAPLHEKGRLSEDEARAIAVATLERELSVARGDDAIARVREARGCAAAADDALARLAKTHDAVGAAAATVRVDAGLASRSSTRAWRSDPDPAWRAVGVRGLDAADDAAARRAAFVDPSAVVRRAAIRAAGDARDPADLRALLEVARLDPDLAARGDAVRAIARLELRTRDGADGLSDLWPSADDGLREDLASALAAPSVSAHGGAEVLGRIVTEGRGPGAIAGASAVLRAGSTSVFSPELRSTARALLRRNIESGPRRERAFALAVAPTEEADVLAAIRKLASDPSDTDARLSALARLLDVPAERDGAVRALEALAAPSDAVAFGRRARATLAAAGDLRVQAWVEKDLSDPDPEVKLGAALALASMGRSARAVSLLFDPDAGVRARAACTIAAARR